MDQKTVCWKKDKETEKGILFSEFIKSSAPGSPEKESFFFSSSVGKVQTASPKVHPHDRISILISNICVAKGAEIG
jgi:hypothetical protein